MPKVYMLPVVQCGAGGVNMVVGLKSVAQVSLADHISDIRGITEVYNLAVAGRINNH